MQDDGRICLGPKAYVGYRPVLGGKARLRVIATLVGALVFTASPFPKASALTSDEGSLLSYTNSARANYGKAKLSLASDLVAVARQHSKEMAAKRSIFHNSSLASDVDGWKKIGENVGRGPSAKSVHDAFMGSSSHRTHILDGAYDQIGIGAVWGSDKLLYVTEIFVDRAGSAPVVSAPKYVPKKYAPAPKVPKRKPKPKPKPPPPVADPLTIGFLLKLVALDDQIGPDPVPALAKQPIR